VINRKQQLFIRYIVAILIDLTVMNLFNEYWPEYMHITSFTLSLFAAVLLQVLLQLTLKVEHIVATYFFEGKSGLKVNILRGLTAWTLIFISKLVMLKAISIAFSGEIAFGGPVHGVVAFIIIIATMIIAEQILLKIHNALADTK
jgi:hypothetical protein